MKIHNLTERDRVIADIMWNAASMDDLRALVKQLPREDQLRAMALTEVVAMGGDEVESVAESQQYLQRFRIQNG